MLHAACNHMIAGLQHPFDGNLPAEQAVPPAEPDNHEAHEAEHNHKGHMKHMIICCGLPIVLLLLLPLFGYKGSLLILLPLICPIMMIAMMPMMMRKK